MPAFGQAWQKGNRSILLWVQRNRLPAISFRRLRVSSAGSPADPLDLDPLSGGVNEGPPTGNGPVSCIMYSVSGRVASFQQYDAGSGPSSLVWLYGAEERSHSA